MSTVIQQAVGVGTIYSAVFSDNSHVTDMVHRCMVYTERARKAAVSCGTSHVSAVKHVYTASVNIQKRAIKDIHSSVALIKHAYGELGSKAVRR